MTKLNPGSRSKIYAPKESTSEILGEKPDICRIARDNTISFEAIFRPRVGLIDEKQKLNRMAAAQEDVKLGNSDPVDASNGSSSESSAVSMPKPAQAEDAAAGGRRVEKIISFSN